MTTVILRKSKNTKGNIVTDISPNLKVLYRQKPTMTTVILRKSKNTKGNIVTDISPKLNVLYLGRKEIFYLTTH